jgi:hypothetical protein
MADYTWGLAIPPTGSSKGPVPAGGVFAQVSKARNRKLSFRVDPDQGHECSFDVNGRATGASDMDELVTDVVVRRDNQWLFRGRIMPTQDVVSGAQSNARHLLSVTAKDYREILKHRFQFHNTTLAYTGVDQGDIAWGLIAYTQALPGGYLGITRGPGSVATGVVRTITYAVTDGIGDKIAELAQMDGGFDWDLTLTGFGSWRFDMWLPYRGRLTARVYEDGSDQVQSITRQVDPSGYVNEAYVTGDSSASLTPQLVTAADIATRPEGRWESAVGTPVLTQAALNSRAAFALATGEVISPSYAITLKKDSWRGPADVWLGDFVTVRIKSGRLNVNAQYRVMQLDIDVGDSGEETVTLTVNRIPARLGTTVAAIQRNLRKLNLR